MTHPIIATALFVAALLMLMYIVLSILRYFDNAQLRDTEKEIRLKNRLNAEFTGVYDINGHPIMEGSIIQYGNGGDKFIVKYKEEVAAYKAFRCYGDGSLYKNVAFPCLDVVSWNKCKIV